jgi:hypothetical protein
VASLEVRGEIIRIPSSKIMFKLIKKKEMFSALNGTHSPTTALLGWWLLKKVCRTEPCLDWSIL